VYPLIYHLRVDDYIPSREFEPHLFDHIPEWQRPTRRPSLAGRLGSLLMRAARAVRGRAAEASPGTLHTRYPCEPVIRWR
jgi:hypothetical protein